MSLGPFFRFIGTHNVGEYQKVIQSKEVWGKEARTLATGLCVQAVPLARASTDNGYNFKTDVVPKVSLGFPLTGPQCVREVFWFEGNPGVECRGNDDYVAIAVTAVKKGRN